ncbi:four helix bundle protein [Plebeiibacterium marinum]|uniref:Four helix bundle protein n=1 Tax=Plebeiibacterium marinum TaxID=2992111 RepID=A0AAE3SHW4_9BACT|nr:four helix bundle protein [Plebeiobacterium marinum]MCW3804007.1 four helix bundle protein [Plebeiobacterium marinum]
MKIDKFEDILAWQKAKCLTVEIYQEIKGINDHSFKDQLQRASVSIMNNIAEGFERKSNKEFKYFLFVAKGSCAEVRSMLHLASELKIIQSDKSDQLLLKSIEISKMLSGFIKKL